MPFPMKVQPIDPETYAIPKPASRSRLKRLFDLQFANVLRSSGAPEKPGGRVVGEVGELEPNSLILGKMVLNYMEDNEKTPVMTSAGRYGRGSCNCFNRSSNDSSDDDFDFDFGLLDSKSSFSDCSDTLKSLIPCPSKEERNLLVDTSKIVEKNKGCKRKEDLVKILIQSLLALNYNAALCKSKWDKTSSISAGEYEYIDVIIEEERILIDVDFRSEFEIARSTGNYRTILLSLPIIFVGKSDRMSHIIAIVAEAGMHSLKKKGLHVPPWRKAEYIKSKWLGDFKRIPVLNDVGLEEEEKNGGCVYEGGELDLIFGDKATSFEVEYLSSSENCDSVVPSGEVSGEGEKLDFSVEVPWQPPPVKLNNKKAVVAGLASLLKEKF